MAGLNTISFLSDYGLDDEFAGVVRSVIGSISPDARIIDITHGIPVHDVRAGSLALARSVQYLNPGVVLAVVDPGVGTERRAVAVEVGGGQSVLVGPDNGLLASAVAICDGATRAVELTNADYQLPSPGSTFDGRDVFAPAAGHLCAGVLLERLGREIDPSSLQPGLVPLTRQEDEGLVAEVLWVDRFGNAQLNVDPDEVNHFGDRILLGRGERSRVARRVDNYAAIATGEVGLIVDSYGLLSVALDCMSAAEVLDLGAGDEVVMSDPVTDPGAEPVSTPVSLERPAS
jgi:S-adenosylmethionine hydrolase